jgi:hypothetical protein
VQRISLAADHCWVIRAPSKIRPGRYQYHCYERYWNHLPTAATIYRTEEIAHRLIQEMRESDCIGFSIEDKVEAVPLEGALRTCGLAIMTKDQ